MKKHLFIFTLSLFLGIIVFCTVMVFAETEIVDSGTCGENATWTLDSGGTLTISGTGDMEDYGSYSQVPYYSYVGEITKVVIENGVTKIGKYAFCYCDALTEIIIPNSVTSIAESVFFGCDALEIVYITNISAYLNIDFEDYSSYPMYYADKLYLDGERVVNLTVPEDVDKIPMYAFYNCSSLRSVTISDGVESIGEHAFQGCAGLKSVVIGSDVTSIGNSAFSSCDGLTDVKIGNSVTSIGICAFSNCSNIINITIPNSVTEIGEYAFSFCTALERVTIGKGITNIQNNMFSYCVRLKTIAISKSVSEIDEDAFLGCSSITTVEYEGSNVDWKEIYIEIGNEYLENATINYAVWQRVVSVNTEVVSDIILVTPTNAQAGDCFIAICYKDNKIVFLDKFVYDDETTIPFVPDTEYDSIKILVWESMEKLNPLYMQ